MIHITKQQNTRSQCVHITYVCYFCIWHTWHGSWYMPFVIFCKYVGYIITNVVCFEDKKVGAFSVPKHSITPFVCGYCVYMLCLFTIAQARQTTAVAYMKSKMVSVFIPLKRNIFFLFEGYMFTLVCTFTSITAYVYSKCSSTYWLPYAIITVL